jgi:alcohol dehydrogenase
MLGDQSTPRIPMAQVVSYELEIYGSHGMQAWRYDAMLAMLEAGKIAPQKLIARRISLPQGIEAMTTMHKSEAVGMSVITDFR